MSRGVAGATALRATRGTGLARARWCGAVLVGLIATGGCRAALDRTAADGATEDRQRSAPVTAAASAPAERAEPPREPQPAASRSGELATSLGSAPDGPSHDARPAHVAELRVPGHLPAVVQVPAWPTARAAPPRRPVLVATHGAGGSPERHCAIWAELVGERAFVLCLRGRAINPYFGGEAAGYFYPSHVALARELAAAFAALLAQYPDEIDATAPVYAGFSQGASMGALLLPTQELGFTRAALVEGGFGQFQEWNVAAARRFHERSGARVLLACGRPACLELARPTRRYLEQGGLEPKLLYVPAAGHSMAEPMRQALREGLEWLVSGDSRWEQPRGPAPGHRAPSAVDRPEN